MEYNLIAPIELPLIQQIFKNRGMNPEEVEKYLRPNESMAHDFFLLDNIKKGARMLATHLVAEDDTLLIVDCDADGFTSAAVLANYLERFAPHFVNNHLNYYFHAGKQHGLVDCVEEAKKYKFIIAPDSSSNDYEQHKELKDLGIDILVLDHHEADYVSSDACVINNQFGDYPNRTLSGVGVVYKFCKYLDMLLGENYADDYLDLVAVGMVGDMIDLRPLETRYFIATGLENPRNPFVKGMMEKNNFKIQGELSPFKISFYVAPFINATIRSGGPEDKRMLFTAMLESKAEDLVDSTKRGCFGQQETIIEQVCRNCGNIKNRQDKMADEGLALLENIIEEKNLLSKKLLIITLDEITLDKNIVGLMANKLMGKYKRPVAVLNKTENGWAGSARGYEKSQLKDFKEFVVASNLTSLAQGHANAFGIEIPFENFDKFIEYTEEALKDMEFTTIYSVDYINPNSSDILEIADYKSIWGQNIEEPLVVFEKVKIYKDNIHLLKQNTLKINLPDSDIEFIKFGSSENEFNSLYSENGYVMVNIIGNCSVNEWGGMMTPQIQIKDYEIVDSVKYFF